MPTETLDAAVARLTSQGFTDVCRAETDGIHFRRSQQIFAPEKLKVIHALRIEGTSAPDESSLVFGLESPDGQFRGTFCVSHGPDVDPIDAEAVRLLESIKDSRREQRQKSTLQQQY